MSPTIQFWIRTFIIVAITIVTICICASQVDQGREEGVDGVVDQTFKWTDGLNHYFREDLRRRDTLEICCGLMMDVMILTQLYRWIWHGTTFRIWFAAMIFYAVRALI